jgi:hypothetical protein
MTSLPVTSLPVMWLPVAPPQLITELYPYTTLVSTKFMLFFFIGNAQQKHEALIKGCLLFLCMQHLLFNWCWWFYLSVHFIQSSLCSIQQIMVSILQFNLKGWGYGFLFRLEYFFRTPQLSRHINVETTLIFSWPSTLKWRWIVVGFESWMDVEKWRWINVTYQRWTNVDATFIQRWINVDACNVNSTLNQCWCMQR